MVKHQAQKKGVKRKQLKNIPSGVVHVKATFNNTIVSITDPAGNTISWASAGKVGYSG
ncbi:ribosomal S11 family protein, partial [Chlamydia psittaci 84-8471/1]